MVTKKEFQDLKDEVDSQRQEIADLKSKVLKLEVLLNQVVSEKSIASHVSDLLHEKIDNLQQYSRRNCLVLDGLPVIANESVSDLKVKVKETVVNDLKIDSTEFDNEFDKTHRIGPVSDNGQNQKVIVRFKSHSFRSKIYRVRKECARRDIKVRLSLTKRRQNLLNFAQTHLENEPNFKFVYADEDGNLKVRTKEPVGRKFVFSFNNEKDIAQLINIIGVESEAFQVLHSDFEVFDNQ